MTDCEKYLDLLSAMVDGELNDGEREQLLKHLESCKDCGALLDIYREASEAITGDMTEPPAELCENVMARVRRPKSKARVIQMASKYLAAAACIALIIFVAPRLDRLGCGASSKDTAAPEAFEFTAGEAEKSAPAEAPAASYATGDGVTSFSAAQEPESVESSAPCGEELNDQQDNSMILGSPTESVDTGAYYAVIWVSGELPDILSDAEFISKDGVMSAETTPDIAEKLISLGYSAQYGGSEKPTALVILTQ